MRLDVIQSLTSEAIELAYGRSPFIPIDQPSPEPTIAARTESVLEELQTTGVLKVAYRQDAPPFGFVDFESNWTGYCADLSEALRNYLSAELSTDLRLDLVTFSSNLDNRFDLVQDGIVHLECGPNTIRSGIEAIQFSQPFFATGNRLLIQAGADINPNRSLRDVRVGVLENTTTSMFLEANYPDADLIYFSGVNGQAEAVQAIGDEIDAFADDSVLLVGEAIASELPFEAYELVPDLPLTCDFYGLVLPAGDAAWQTTINRFLASETVSQSRDRWLDEAYADEFNILEYCLNE